MTSAGATSIDGGLAGLDYSARATRDRGQVDRAVRRNIAEFIDQLETFAAQQRIVTAGARGGPTIGPGIKTGPAIRTGSTAGSQTASRF